MLVLPLALTVWAPGAFPDYSWCDPRLTDMAFADDLRGFAVGTCMSVYRTLDGGATWVRDETTGDIGQVNAIHLAGSTAVAVGKNAINQPTALVSTDAGASFDWHIFYLTDPNGVWNEGTLTDARVVSPSVLVATAAVWDGQGAIARSVDGGETWTTVAWLPDAIRTLDLVDGALVAIATGGIAYASSDGGATWQARGLAPVPDVADAASDGSRIVIVGAAGTAASSLDGGATWTPIVTGTAADLNAIVYHGDDLVAAGAAGTILRSTDDGLTWAPELSTSSGDLFSLAFTTTRGLAGGTEEVLVRTSVALP